MADEIICECGHKAKAHGIFGCRNGFSLSTSATEVCACALNETDILRARIAALTLAVGERDKTIGDMKEVLKDSQAHILYGSASVVSKLNLLDRITALIAETAPATEAGK